MTLDVNSPEHDALRRESRDYWAKGYIYESWEGNNRFLAFRAGYELGRSKGEVGK